MGKLRNILTPFVHRIIVATSILIFTLLYLFEISSLKNAQDKLLVNPVIWIIFLLYPIIIWQEWREKRKKETTHEATNEAESEASSRLSKKVFLFMISTLLYLVLMNYIGFIISTIAFMPFLMWVLGTSSKKILIILPIATTVVLYLLFNNLLGIPLPQGIILQGVL
ncbi:tripartite tricarboxylate transporter TctB family protein [Pseudogracilibacillus sp. SE30717A]|uniref:tripartite tricarboxylate transporter TctB family protein n=1 Tax=Pseudogracilibacillus sp. SE30717A TaxID=3098293 RepID=UPI00300DDD94